MQNSIKEFVRIIITDTIIRIFHLKDRQNLNDFYVLLKDNSQIFTYLQKYKNIPIEVVIASNTMINRVVNLRNLNESDIKTLSQNILTEKKDTVNIVVYEHKISYRNGFVNICSMKLAAVLMELLDQLLSSNNSAIFISTWPIWVVSNYFKKYPSELNKFETSIFIGEYSNRWEIITTQNKKIINYRQGNIENFNLKEETENVLKYIKEVFNVSAENVVIYSIDEELINEFSSILQVDMKLVSNFKNFMNFNKNKSLSNVFKSACIAGFLVVFGNTVFDIVKIFNYNHLISENTNELNSLNSNIKHDINLWRELKGYNYEQPLSLKECIYKQVNLDKIVKSINIDIDEKSNQLNIDVLYEK